jgi:RNA polymerase sigma factor (sigma-70 family)
MISNRKRFSRPIHRQYQCFNSSHAGPCPQCQTVIQTYEENLPLLKKIAYRLVQDSHQTEDYLYEFYQKKLSTKSHKFKIDDESFNVLNYMITILRHFIFDEQRRRGRQNIIEGWVVGLTREADELILPDLSFQQLEARTQLQQIYSVLKAPELELIQQFLNPDWTIETEARRTGVKNSAVRARINRIRAKLRHLTAFAV